MRALRAALRHRRSDAAAGSRRIGRADERARVPGEALGAESAPGGGVVRFARSTLRIEVVAGGAVFVGWDGALPEPSPALDGTPPQPDVRAFLEPDTDGGWRVVSERALVTVSRHGTVEVHTPGGALLRRDLPPRWWEAEPVEAAPRWVQRCELPADARLFGLGTHGRPHLEDGTYALWNEAPSVRPTDEEHAALTMPVQLAVADAGCHLVFHDNTSEGTLQVRHGVEGLGSGLDRPGRCELRMAGGPVRYWVLPGAPARVLRGWTQLSGRPTAPPAWALGHHHVPRAGAHIGEVVESLGAWRRVGAEPAVVELTEDAATPLRGERPSLVGELRSRGVRTTAGVEPAVPVGPESESYRAGTRAGVFVRDARGLEVHGAAAHGPVVYPDLTEPRVREWWARAYRADGPDGYLHRHNQPASPAPFDTPALPRSARHACEGRGGDHGEAHNVYPLAMAEAGAAALTALRPVQRPFLASESGWAGMQRYAGALVQPTARGWAGLRQALAEVLALGLCGMPFAGPLLGGPEAEADGELLVRGLELGSHLPSFRTAATLLPWPAALEGAGVLVEARQALDERRRLQPYLVTLAHLAERTGAPCVRPLWWQYPRDRQLRDCADAFLLGDALLVAPVCAAGVRRRTVRLPRGRWYDTLSGRAFTGPTTVDLDAPLGRAPVLARAGAVIPVTGASGDTELEVWAPMLGRTGNGLVLTGDDTTATPQPERFVVRGDSGEVRVEGEDGAEVPYVVRVWGV